MMIKQEGFLKRTFRGTIEIVFAAISIYLIVFTLNEVFDNVIVDYIKNHTKYITSDSIAVKSLSNDEKATIEKLINSGVILTSNDLLERSIEFYTNVISVLVFTVSLFSVVAFIYIKGSVEDKNSIQIRSAVSTYFETDRAHYLKTLEVIKNEFEGWTEEFDLDKIDQISRKTDSSHEEFRGLRTELEIMNSKYEQLRQNVDEHINTHSNDNRETSSDTMVNPGMVSS
ncbi:hypothetical protein D3C77_246440 [compost metagenome]